MKLRSLGIALLLPFAGSAAVALAADPPASAAEALVREAFVNATPEEWRERLAQDDAQALCSRYRNAPPPEVAARILEAQRATLRLPEDGRLMGDWRAGEKLAGIGTGGHIGRIQPDPPGRAKGGNCYACHVLAPTEVAAGNIGPSLTGYGRQRGNTPEMQRYTFGKIYNAQAFLPCSHMPRFGLHGWLTPQQIADLTAFLLDPASSVNAER
jgi:sulfur-oxidizing protein SoxX